MYQIHHLSIFLSIIPSLASPFSILHSGQGGQSICPGWRFVNRDDIKLRASGLRPTRRQGPRASGVKRSRGSCRRYRLGKQHQPGKERSRRENEKFGKCFACGVTRSEITGHTIRLPFPAIRASEWLVWSADPSENSMINCTSEQRGGKMRQQTKTRPGGQEGDSRGTRCLDKNRPRGRLRVPTIPCGWLVAVCTDPYYRTTRLEGYQLIRISGFSTSLDRCWLTKTRKRSFPASRVSECRGVGCRAPGVGYRVSADRKWGFR